MTLPAPPSGWVDLSSRTKILLTGADRLRYLNGQVTNDVSRATPDQPVYALVTNAKGKIEADVFIAPHPEREALLVDAPSSLREPLAARLDRYIVADDVALEDVTEAFGLFHHFGSDPPEVAAPAWVRSTQRYGLTGWDVLIPAGPQTPAWQLVDAAALETWRIAAAIPDWDAELSLGVFPQEARLENRAVDFAKGCYIGQEVVSRIRSAGKVNRLLCSLHADLPDREAPLPAPGSPLFDGDREAGFLTSVARSPEGDRMEALGYVKKNHWQAGTRLAVQDAENALTYLLEIREFQA